MTLNPEDASTHASYVDERFPGPDPYAPLASRPTPNGSREAVAGGDRLPEAQPGGDAVSRQLRWEPGPAGTAGYGVTCCGPDAPTAGGVWHWAVFNIPACVTSLRLDAGDDEGSCLPKG